jgi:hypothetical protein
VRGARCEVRGGGVERLQQQDLDLEEDEAMGLEPKAKVARGAWPD